MTQSQNMCRISVVTFSEYLESQYLEWQRAQGKRKTIEDFAAWIGVSRPLLNMWMNGNRKPGKESLKLLSGIFGNEVYDVLGYPRPNPYLQKINQLFENLSEEQQRRLAEEADQYLIKNDIERVQKSSKKRKASTRQ